MYYDFIGLEMVCSRILVLFYLVALGRMAIADELDSPPTFDDILEERHSICTADNASRVWEFATHGFAEHSSVLIKGVPHALKILGEPKSSVREETGVWDIDVYVIRRTLSFEGVKIVTYDFINQGLGIDLAAAKVEDGKAIQQMVVDGQHLLFTFGLRIGSTREQVEQALGLPCWPVAQSGRLAVRQLASYVYLASNPDSAPEYTVTFHFDDADTISSVDWELQSRH